MHQCSLVGRNSLSGISFANIVYIAWLQASGAGQRSVVLSSSHLLAGILPIVYSRVDLGYSLHQKSELVDDDRHSCHVELKDLSWELAWPVTN